ncbi:MAG: acyl-CoA dehydrogenase family protein [Betaproteobacteria bacterium]|nr:acyl-CoA dehydrogenase family protein [Betaproteobacteria bacterium]
MTATHQVENQPPALTGYNAFSSDAVFASAVRSSPGAWVAEQAAELGALVGDAAWQQLAHDANRFTPELVTHDRFGHRADRVDFHPAYHALMAAGIERGVHALAWSAGRDGAFSARAALFFLWNQLEQGTACPMTMTFAARQVFTHVPALEKVWVPKLTANRYDPRPLSVAEKSAVTVGMAMTEKQGGSDLRAVQTRAVALADGTFALTGHKWFCSAPMSDAFFTLARTADGVGCFFVPRSLPDGARNTFLVQRLKEKVGNRSNASSEIEYRDTLAWPVGEPGRGIATLIEMAHLTRFDIVVGTAGMMRAALHQVAHHVRHRAAFGKRLADHALMQNVVADLMLDGEAALLLALRLARAFDLAQTDMRERLIMRVLTPIAKYWHTKRITPWMVEAMECFGGNGFVEEHPMARLYREAPLNGIWEGSGNVICLDVLRAMQKTPEAVRALLDEIQAAAHDRPALITQLANIRSRLADPAQLEASARRLVEDLALAAQAALLCEYSQPEVADAFIASRISREGGHAFGTIPARFDAAALAARAGLAPG